MPSKRHTDTRKRERKAEEQSACLFIHCSARARVDLTSFFSLPAVIIRIEQGTHARAPVYVYVPLYGRTYARVRAQRRKRTRARRSRRRRGGSDACEGHGVRALIAFNKANNSKLIRDARGRPKREGFKYAGERERDREGPTYTRRAKQKRRKRGWSGGKIEREKGEPMKSNKKKVTSRSRGNKRGRGWRFICCL